MIMRTTRIALLSAGIVLIAGCHVFVPIESAAVAPGTAVRITLTREETLRQARDLDLGQLQSELTGIATDATSAQALTFTYRLPSPTPSQPNRFNGLMSVPWSSIISVEEKRFSAGRTIGLAAIGAAIAVAVLGATNDSGTSPQDDTGPTPNAAIIPFFRFVF